MDFPPSLVIPPDLPAVACNDDCLEISFSIDDNRLQDFFFLFLSFLSELTFFKLHFTFAPRFFPTFAITQSLALIAYFRWTLQVLSSWALQVRCPD